MRSPAFIWRVVVGGWRGSCLHNPQKHGTPAERQSRKVQWFADERRVRAVPRSPQILADGNARSCVQQTASDRGDTEQAEPFRRDAYRSQLQGLHLRRPFLQEPGGSCVDAQFQKGRVVERPIDLQELFAGEAPAKRWRDLDVYDPLGVRERQRPEQEAIEARRRASSPPRH